VSALGRFTLRVRVLTLLVGLAAVLAVVGVITSLAVGRTRDADNTLRTRIQPAADRVENLYVDYLNQETGQRGYDLTSDPAFYQPYVDGTAAAVSDVDALRTLLPGAETRTKLANVVTLHETWVVRAAEPQKAAADAHDLRKVQQLVASGVGRVQFDQIRVALKDLAADLGRRRDAAIKRADRASRQVFWALGVGAAALLGGIVVAGWLLRRWVLVPTMALQQQLRRVADGGYSEQIEAFGPPELAALATDAELMRERIVTELDRSRQAIEALYQSGPVVAGLREELAASPSLFLPGLSLHGVLSAAEGILAGDWYDAVPLTDGRTALLIADVSGHGAAAGLVALRVKLSLTSALSLGLGPAAALAHATSTFAQEEERFASCVVVALDPFRELITWANAGHPSPLLYTPGSAEGPDHVELEPTGPLLSFLDGDWEERTVPFRTGQLLLGYTDGLTEARDQEGNQFGIDGILRALRELPVASPAAAVVACMAAVRSHAVDLRRDDVTVVAVAREE
jgi:serine phosphatase RsbU (regulator of sigma subunit)/CHASE3 domain sensor protein